MTEISNEEVEAAQPDGSAVDPEWLALLDRARAGGEDAQDAVIDAYQRGIEVGIRRAGEAVLAGAVVSDDPSPTTDVHELTASFGLEPAQEIRDRGLERADSLLSNSDPAAMAESGVLWKLADQCAAYIRDGSRP